MYVDNKSSQAFLYSKHQKQLEGISKHWREKVEGYNERSDEGAITDSQDEYDHGVCPMDPNVMEYQK